MNKLRYILPLLIFVLVHHFSYAQSEVPDGHGIEQNRPTQLLKYSVGFRSCYDSVFIWFDYPVYSLLQDKDKLNKAIRLYHEDDPWTDLDKKFYIDPENDSVLAIELNDGLKPNPSISETSGIWIEFDTKQFDIVNKRKGNYGNDTLMKDELSLGSTVLFRIAIMDAATGKIIESHQDRQFTFPKDGTVEGEDRTRTLTLMAIPFVDDYKFQNWYSPRTEIDGSTQLTVSYPLECVMVRNFTSSFHTIIAIYRRNTSSISENLNNNDIFLYPNPAEESITLNTEREMESIIVYDVLGVPRLLESSGNNTFSVSALDNGVYSALLNSLNGQQKISFIVQK